MTKVRYNFFYSYNHSSLYSGSICFIWFIAAVICSWSAGLICEISSGNGMMYGLSVLEHPVLSVVVWIFHFPQPAEVYRTTSCKNIFSGLIIRCPSSFFKCTLTLPMQESMTKLMSHDQTLFVFRKIFINEYVAVIFQEHVASFELQVTDLVENTKLIGNGERVWCSCFSFIVRNALIDVTIQASHLLLWRVFFFVDDLQSLQGNL